MRRLALGLLSAIVGLACASASAFADPPRAAVHSYISGNYLIAADLAEASGSSDSLAFAAQALMAQCITARPQDLGPLLDRGERAAREALERDPRSVDARLQLALIYGVRGRQASIGEAVRRGYAPHGRRLIEEALAINPNEAWGHALLGGWHLEVLRRGGRAGALAYGARRDTGIAEFERARQLAPNDPLIPLHFAIALLQLDSDRYAGRAANLLSISQGLGPRDAFEAHALAQGRRVAAALDEQGPAAAVRVASASFP